MIGLLKRRSTAARLGLLLALVAAFALGSAALDYALLDQFDTYGDALWSAVVHLLDPSALQDDETAARRAVGIVQVLAGLILLAGVLFTVVSEIVGRSLERLGRTDAPVHTRDHLVLMGGVDLLPFVVSAIGEVRARLGAGHEPPNGIVVMVAPEHLDARHSLAADLRRRAGGLRVRVLVGDLESGADLVLASPRTARAVLVMPLAAQATGESADVDVVRLGMLLAEHLDAAPSSPDVFLLFRRGRDADAAWELFPPGWDAIVGDRAMSAALRVALLQPRFAPMLPSVAGGQRPLVVSGADVAGAAFGTLAGRFEDALPLGLVRTDGSGSSAVYAPPPGTEVQPGDGVIVLAADAAAAVPRPAAAAADPIAAVAPGPRASERPPGLRLLVVGWGFNERELLEELSREGVRVELTVLADPAALRAALPKELPAGISVRRLEGITTDPADLHMALREARPEVVLVAASATTGDLSAAQAAGALTILHLRRLIEAGGPRIVGDLYFPAAGLRASDHGEVIVASLEQVALGLAISLLDPQTATAYQGLLSGEQARLEVRTFAPAGGREASFAAVYQGLLEVGAVPVSLAPAGAAAELRPAPGTPVRPGDQLLVVQRRDAAGPES